SPSLAVVSQSFRVAHFDFDLNFVSVDTTAITNRPQSFLSHSELHTSTSISTSFRSTRPRLQIALSRFSVIPSCALRLRSQFRFARHDRDYKSPSVVSQSFRVAHLDFDLNFVSLDTTAITNRPQSFLSHSELRTSTSISTSFRSTRPRLQIALSRFSVIPSCALRLRSQLRFARHDRDYKSPSVVSQSFRVAHFDFDLNFVSLDTTAITNRPQSFLSHSELHTSTSISTSFRSTRPRLQIALSRFSVIPSCALRL